MKDMNSTCDRTNDLVAFMYQELNEAEARDFNIHLRQCASCRLELESFSEVRESIVSWRDASLGALSAKENSVKVPALQPRRSAVTAVREFFSLSPMWLKGAVAFASLIFCLCAAMAVA